MKQQRILLLVMGFLMSMTIVAQEDYFLTPQDKAYLFHTVRKSPILEQNIGRYFHYSGSDIRLPNGEINYDSIELTIINQPEKLIIYSEEIRKAPKGVLAEAANKQAVWELNKLLHSKRKKNLEKNGLENQYAQFESYFLPKLPSAAFKEKKGEKVLHPKIDNILHPSLTFKDKVAMLEGFSSWTAKDIQQVLEASNYAINAWVENRAFELFKKLGGEADLFQNVLTAAGDGSSTSGLFEEREKDEKGRWNRGLPKAVGLFPYGSQVTIDQSNKKPKETVEPLRYAILDFETFGENRHTSIHVDVWGYNSEKQTTVVIEKSGKSYPLFGSTESRFLSPDSSFTGKATYYTMINRVKKDIADLEESISGKKGLDYKIEYFGKKKDDKLLQIVKTEKELSDLRMNPIITNDKKYKTSSGAKTRRTKQDALVTYYDQLSALKRKILELEERKERIEDLIGQKNQQLFHMYNLIGREWMTYTEEKGLYLFEDSSTFDLLTQEFTFAPTKEKEHFEVRLIPIPYSHESDEVDEVMLHVNVVDAKPKYNAKVQLTLQDAFASNKYELSGKLLSNKDSIAIQELFEALLMKDMDFNIIARGEGVGQWNGYRTVRDRNAEEWESYPGSSAKEKEQRKMDSTLIRLRVSQIDISIDREITLEVNSFTDPVKTNFSAPSSSIQEKVMKYQISGNKTLSAYRTYAILKQLQQELNILAGQYLNREEAKDVIDRMNKKFHKSSILMGKYSFKLKDFE